MTNDLEEKARSYLDVVKPRLTQMGFSFAEDVMDQAVQFQLVATRKKFEASKMGRAKNCFTFATLPALDAAGLRAFSAVSFQHARSAMTGGPPRGLGGSRFVFPVALTTGLDPETERDVRRKAPKRHWAAAEMPSVVDLAAGRLVMFERTPFWGAAYFRGFRKLISTVAGPSPGGAGLRP